LPIAWNDDSPGAATRIRRNLETLLRRLVDEAAHRAPPTVELAQGWHREAFAGVELPVPYFAGEVRDDDPRYPELIGYEVLVGTRPGVPSHRVPAELARFEARMQRAVEALDGALPAGERPREAGILGSVITLCAYAHGEWARIHPFANGNGRTARLWANWCALRYGLPIFVRLRPRPDGHRYARAAADSMAGDHRAMVSLFADWLEAQMTGSG
jgi:fido (protein-threonine AMPylation protein)